MNEPTGLVTIAIIAITALFSAVGFASPPFMERYLFEPEMVLRYRQHYRLVSSGFLHANVAHLVINMFSLYSFGGSVESTVGAPTFIVIYFSSILGGNLLSLLLHRNEAYRALGASGGVCGVVFASIFLIPGSSVYMLPIPVPIPSPVYAVLFIAISVFGIQNRRGNIGHDAHLGGAIIGLIVTTLLYPRIVTQNLYLWILVMGVAAALFIYLYWSQRRRSGGRRVARGERDERGRRPWS
jgi:membrane associated rhomboid family serine protease